MCPGGADGTALSIALMIEDIVGPPPQAELESFL
jgi:hypothetical protein